MNKHLKDRFHYLFNRIPTEHEVFTLITGIDRDYPDLGIFQKYSDELINKTNERITKN